MSLNRLYIIRHQQVLPMLAISLRPWMLSLLRAQDPRIKMPAYGGFAPKQQTKVRMEDASTQKCFERICVHSFPGSLWNTLPMTHRKALCNGVMWPGAQIFLCIFGAWVVAGTSSRTFICAPLGKAEQAAKLQSQCVYHTATKQLQLNQSTRRQNSAPTKLVCLQHQ